MNILNTSKKLLESWSLCNYADNSRTGTGTAGYGRRQH